MSRETRFALAVICVLSMYGCARFYFYRPALVEGTVVSATSGAPIRGARVSFENRVGDLISDAPAVSTDGDGGFVAGSRESRTLVGFEMMEAIESKLPVTIRIEADGYEPRLLDVEGKVRYRRPILLMPLNQESPETQLVQ